MTELLLGILGFWAALATLLFLLARHDAREQHANLTQLAAVAPYLAPEWLQRAIVMFTIGIADEHEREQVCAAVEGALRSARSKAADSALHLDRLLRSEEQR